MLTTTSYLILALILFAPLLYRLTKNKHLEYCPNRAKENIM